MSTKKPTAEEQRLIDLNHAIVNRRNAAVVAMQVATKDLNGETPTWAWAAIAAAEWAAAVDLQVEEILRILQEQPRRRGR